MVAVHRRPAWFMSESLATPESAFLNRRTLLQAMGFGIVAAGGGLGRAQAEETDPSADLYPAKRNDSYKLDRSLTPEEINANYNNFYEFGTQKEIAQEAQSLRIRPWEIQIGGLVDAPMTIAFDDLVRKFPLETRLYRHRCVEAWSMTIPWSGFALSRLVELAKPQAAAKFIRFETFLDPSMASGQNSFIYPWPYVEGVTMEEAANELAFVVTGAYEKPLLKQFGAPIRLALPWKYGFKSIKSIRKIDFVPERPVGLWEALQSSEYGFWANVNPDVPHPRWSQANERVLHTGDIVPTQLFNGYGAQVADLYKDMDPATLYM
ncbi:MAG TPA: protein-methionine-sulfoxide reductase catalytic subunit MsrP [Rhizobiaceae bacterium]|nr:protein-methionine-sulfoxide reductase catalytic subunit MsrP [Rhizobiaceae bacterium]